MADDTAVNSQVTDSVTQSNVMTLGVGAANSLANLYQQMAQSNGLGMQNAVARQQHQNSVDTAVITQSVNAILSLPTATSARAAMRQLAARGGGGGQGEQLIALAAIRALGELIALRRHAPQATPESQSSAFVYQSAQAPAPQASSPAPDPAPQPSGPFPQGKPRP
ncbi:RebB family R body protein [Oceanibacterium hippocampi]|uniref:Killing trait n=1 Tax=Oceanibacterium hippocampi TaxID=745714 RepID=A0A1Y5T8I5_9PROT|nr:RebB family R body protein [Oceanibacterium hippocampi]SLN57804.1 Killing trait [Oceanibacterium hippocampi]